MWSASTHQPSPSPVTDQTDPYCESTSGKSSPPFQSPRNAAQISNKLSGPAHLRTFKYSNDLDVLRERIRLIYRLAAKNRKTFLVLGAFGCRAYRCPPVTVAREMRAILEEEEFEGWSEEVVFAIFGKQPRPGQRGDTGYENFRIFKGVFEGGR